MRIRPLYRWIVPTVLIYGMAFAAGQSRPSRLASSAPLIASPFTEDLLKGFAARALGPYRSSEARRVGKGCRSRWSPFH